MVVGHGLTLSARNCVPVVDMPYCRTSSCRYMTISDMKLKKTLSAALTVAVLSPAITIAQAQAPAATVARQVLPTGPMTATTKSAAAIRASRAAQMNAARGAATTAGGAAAARSTSVVGYLWTANNSAIPDATVQLRNTVTGQVEFFTQSNAIGEFTFNNVAGGSYVIEYASEQAGSLLALGHPFTVAPGETVATFVRMSNAIPALIPDLTGNIAASAIQSAASAGVTTIVTPIAPVVDAAPPPSSPVR
jgi:hypothetical protein